MWDGEVTFMFLLAVQVPTYSGGSVCSVSIPCAVRRDHPPGDWPGTKNFLRTEALSHD